MMEEKIFDLFRQAKCKVGHIVPMRNIMGLMQTLNPVEQQQLGNVLQRLESQGYFTYEADDVECLRLTQKGYDHIYKPCSMTDSELEEKIFDLFRQAKCKVGHIVPMRNIMGLIQTLNPVEQQQLGNVLQRLESQGYFTYEADDVECLRLTQKGYESIY